MTIFFTSDTHFGHANILSFTDVDGQLIRPWFSSVEEMNEVMVERWNGRVKEGDKVYHLGDVGFGRSNIASIMPRLRGSKRLILGNHDDVRQDRLGEFFQKILLWRVFSEEGFVCTHLPVMPENFPGMKNRVVLNVHGHIHEKPDPSNIHWNISVERTDFRPVALEEICDEIKARGL